MEQSIKNFNRAFLKMILSISLAVIFAGWGKHLRSPDGAERQPSIVGVFSEYTRSVHECSLSGCRIPGTRPHTPGHGYSPRSSHSRSGTLRILLPPSVQLQWNGTTRPEHGTISSILLEVRVRPTAERPRQYSGTRPRHRVRLRHQLLPAAEAEPWRNADRPGADWRPHNVGIGDVFFGAIYPLR